MKKHTTLTIAHHKVSSLAPPLQMLTCYDYQSARMLSETELDIILVGDSLGNVILGLDNTIPVTLEQMIVFSQAVKRGAPNKFVVADMPFGTYATLSEGIHNAISLFQQRGAEAVKLEGAFAGHLELIQEPHGNRHSRDGPHWSDTPNSPPTRGVLYAW